MNIKGKLVGNKLIIIDIDALMGTKNKLHHPYCLRSVCDQTINFRGKDGRCQLGMWCASAQYNPKNVMDYRSELNLTEDNCYMAVLPALDKLADAGWLFSIWTTRPRRQTSHIINVLRKTGIWQKAQMFSGTPFLLNNSDLPDDGDFSPATEKLILFEREYSNICDSDWPVVAIESEQLEANVLQAYGGRNVIVHLSPRIWLDILINESGTLDELLVCNQYRDSIISTLDPLS